MREIKFRAWDKEKMTSEIRLEFAHGLRLISTSDLGFGMTNDSDCVLMQFTGLKDKNELQDIYEDDIIDEYGNIKGNTYEMDKGETDLVIQGFGTKEWLTTYQKAVDRGCKDA